jgi:hypothetical protein
MNQGHAAYLQEEIVSSIQRRAYELFRLNKIEFSGRVDLRLSDWEVEYRGTFRAKKNADPEPIRAFAYQHATIWVSMDVDTLFIKTCEFQFSLSSFSNPVTFAEAIEGNAFTVYRTVEPVLTAGFCSSCDKAFQRNEGGTLICGCKFE